MNILPNFLRKKKKYLNDDVSINIKNMKSITEDSSYDVRIKKVKINGIFYKT